MIELIAVLVAFTILAIEFYANRKTKTDDLCKVWVKENRSNEWICVDKQR